VTIRSRNWRDTKLVKDATKKKLFLTELKTCETLEPVRLSWGGITLKSNISFVSVYLQ
jgi:hypothetical protein